MKHTEGPWHVYQGPEDKPELTVNYEDKSGQIIEVADCNSYYVPPKEREANAKLIASAPDLLACVKEFLECGDNAGHNQDLINMARAAISKAGGE